LKRFVLIIDYFECSIAPLEKTVSVSQEFCFKGKRVDA